MGKIFANLISDEELISKIYKEPIQGRAKIIQKEQIIWIDIFPKMTYKWLTGTWKDGQHQ